MKLSAMWPGVVVASSDSFEVSLWVGDGGGVVLDWRGSTGVGVRGARTGWASRLLRLGLSVAVWSVSVVGVVVGTSGLFVVVAAGSLLVSCTVGVWLFRIYSGMVLIFMIG